MPRRSRTSCVALAGGAALLLAACAQEPDNPAGILDPGTPSFSSAELATTLGFRKSVTVVGIREHLAAFAGFASLNGGDRALGTPGYDASVQYVYNRVVAAGYSAQIQEFEFEFRGNVAPPILNQLAPVATTYRVGLDFTTMEASGSGDVTAAVYAVDFLAPGGPSGLSTSGCEAADFAGFPAGSIALLQRGTCTFRDKAQNAANAGAAGVIIENAGVTASSPILGTLGLPVPVSIPAVGTTAAVGEALRQGVLDGPTQTTARLDVNYVVENRTGRNVIGESRTGDPSRVVVVGAGLEGADISPGINLASGAATTLEIAEAMSQQGRTTTPRLRYIWFGGAGGRRVGADYYLGALSPEERGRLKAMLGIGPLGSVNFGRFVYDGDFSTFPSSTTPAHGSDAIEMLFADYFAGVGQAQEPTSVGLASDLSVFLQAGVPSGGVVSNPGGDKSAAQAALYGGTAGASFDPCFGVPCDLLTNLSTTALDQMSDAVAHVVLLLSKRNLAKSPL